MTAYRQHEIVTLRALARAKVMSAYGSTSRLSSSVTVSSERWRRRLCLQAPRMPLRRCDKRVKPLESACKIDVPRHWPGSVCLRRQVFMLCPSLRRLAAAAGLQWLVPAGRGTHPEFCRRRFRHAPDISDHPYRCTLSPDVLSSWQISGRPRRAVDF